MLGAAQAVFLGACPAVVPQVYDDHVDEFGATLHWPLDATGGTDFAERIVGGDTHEATGSGEIEYVDDTIAQQDTGGRCLGLGGGSDDSMLTVSSWALFDSTAGFWGCLIQPDVTDKKQHIVNRPGSAAGGFALELLADGTLYAYRNDGSGTFREITSAAGTVAAGEAAHVGMSWGAAGLRLFKNGSVIASEDTPTTDWGVSNTNDIRFGRWFDGRDGFDGLIAHVVFRTTEPAAEEVAQIALPRGISLLTGADLGTIEESQTTTLDPREHGHFKGAITPVVTTQGQDGTAAVSGELVEYTAGDTADPNGDSFGLTVTDDRGTTLEVAFTIEVIEAVTGEYITTVEAQPSWNGDPSDASAVVAAFAEAISEANSNAGSSSTGRGVVELVQGRTYMVEASNGTTVTSIEPAIDMNLDNVELRTQGKPTIASGNQAVIKFVEWASQTNVQGRSVVNLQADNLLLGWVELHGNKESTGSDFEERNDWVGEDGELLFDFGNGGIMNLVFYGPMQNITVKEVNCHSSLVDGFFWRQAGTGLITNVLIEDCDVHHNRRQGMTPEEGGDTAQAWDQIVFRRVKFRDTGDEDVMWGQAPGTGVDMEPLNTSRPYYGWTYEDCDFSDNQGGSLRNGVFSPGSGRGLLYDGGSDVRYLKVINCRANGNKNEGFLFNFRDGGDLGHAILEDLVAKNSQSGSNDDEIKFDDHTAEGSAFVADTQIINCDVNLILFTNKLHPTNNDVTIWKGDFDPTIVKNGRETVTVNEGFPPG